MDNKTSAQFEQKLTPETEKKLLQEKIARDPGAVHEIIKEHISQIPEKVFESSYLVTEEQKEFMKKQMADPDFGERNQRVGYFLAMVADKGILPVVAAVRDVDPALADQIHDILVSSFSSPEGGFGIKNA